MKKWINLNLFKTLSSKAMTISSVMMMVLAPVADGIAAEKVMKDLNEARVKEILVQMGMTKSQTLGEFYKKNKGQMPKRLQNLIGEAVQANKNVKIPQIEMTSSKTTDGLTVPVIRMVFGGELFNVEIHDNDKFFAKIGNTEFTRVEVNNFTTMYEKLYHNDPRFRRLIDNSPEGAGMKSVFPITGNFVRNEFSYPEITRETWNALTPEGRVQYILNMRKLWSDAKTVLMNQNSVKSKKPKDKKTSGYDLLEEIWQLLSPDAGAAGETPAPSDAAANRNARSTEKRETGRTAGTAKQIVNSPCLIAGYTTEYKGKVCSIDAIKTQYAGNDTVKDAQAVCPKGLLACNPLIYGMPDGKPVCIPTNDKAFQQATHYNGPCDPKSPLSNDEIKFLKNEKQFDKGRYEKGNEEMDSDKLLAEIRKQQAAENFGQTKDFLAGVIKSKNKELYDMFVKVPGEINEAILEIIIKTKEEFNLEISSARKACKNSARTAARQEINFWGACDQMQRRELFVADFLETQIKCIDGGALHKETYKCSCPAAKFGEGKVSLPGQKCAGSVPETGAGNSCRPGSTDPVCPTPGGETPEAKCRAFEMNLGAIGKTDQTPENIMCVCANGKHPTSLADIQAKKFDPKKCLEGGAAVTPRPTPEARPAAEELSCSASKVQECTDKKGKIETIESGKAKACICDKDGEEKESWWDRNKGNVIKYGILGVALWALLRSAPKKPTLNPPGDTCANGAVACPTTCPKANQTAVNGVCQCRVPSPLEVLVDPVECTYQTNTGSTTTLTCPNGTTKVTSLTDCPKKACSDGSTVYDGQNCPVETPAAKPTATGVDVKK